MLPGGTAYAPRMEKNKLPFIILLILKEAAYSVRTAHRSRIECAHRNRIDFHGLSFAVMNKLVLFCLLVHHVPAVLVCDLASHARPNKGSEERLA